MLAPKQRMRRVEGGEKSQVVDMTWRNIGLLFIIAVACQSNYPRKARMIEGNLGDKTNITLQEKYY